jgi:hypothetical protein
VSVAMTRANQPVIGNSNGPMSVIRTMKDLSSFRLMYLKAALLLAVGCLSATLLVADRPAIRTVLLVGVTVWAFSRVYYFCFYVIERYVDPSFRFSGLFSVVMHFVIHDRHDKKRAS